VNPLDLFSPPQLAAIEQLVDERVAAQLADRGEQASAPEFLSVSEAAELLRAKPQRIYDLLSSGRLTRVKDGARVLVARAELEAWLRSSR